ncbi:M48 family metallopeptidase [Novosphingobium mangrovi (ex Huang et al. 2023)]|uniref:M48 family metallopeptidase n=1 Tax=Novosphingobium mangrovi (ex Huang et al. 2023) TaxID=2976432 RepID=A0ABT2HZW5_9SPHN|nr:M48 family metallopeptidase [Novosphingobium mangrovi (ex Huang et al. 2023)]MCT2398077.1 M48 family metallopeptidase [Novosphingobium mangrovi (ex Huang et al. 2023)]
MAYAMQDRPLVRDLTGLGDLPQVIAVAPESPAQVAGIRPGDDILSVNATPVSEIVAKDPEAGSLADHLEELLAATPEGEDITLELERGGHTLTISFRGEQLCATRFILKTGKGVTAYSDGQNVALSAKLVDFAQNADELAVFASHELAHVVARDGKAKGLRERRAMEDRADTLGADLMRCAGYNVERGLEIWHRYNQRDILRWLRDPSHRNIPERVRRIEAHIASTPETCPPPGVPELED